jgi:heme/copper-type cytochrome/quinol oxidase subunit 3
MAGKLSPPPSPPAGPPEPPEGLTRAAEEASFYHEAALNATWTGVRLAVGGLSFGFGCFVFAYFYLRSLNSHGMWHPAGFKGPQPWAGALIMALVVGSALLQNFGLTRIKAGRKRAWQVSALAALAMGLAAVGLQVWELLNLRFQPGSSGFASVFTGATPVFLIVVLAAMIWLETLIMRARVVPAISFVEQPPTYAEAFAVQRFQAGLSAFTVFWNYLAVIAIVFWVLFYLTA